MVDSTNLPDVDINQIATDLNGKMDRDCLNASDTGRYRWRVWECLVINILI